MCDKRKCDSDSVGPNKRNWLTLEKKLEFIKCKEDGVTFAKIAHYFKINESPVHTIMKKKQQYIDGGIVTFYMSKTMAKNRNPNILNMESFINLD